MNPIAQAALDRARRPTPAPAPATAYSTETAYRPKPIPVLVVHGPINEYMRQQARKEATEPADLTERDERIDQLQQQPRVPDGFALVPKNMLLSKEVIGVINFHCGDTDQEEGGQFGQYTDGRLWVGYVLDDDGNKVHGLHIATDEYPEEGSTTLVEFPEPGAHQEPNQCGGCQVNKDGPKAEVMDISDLGADAVCGICYDTGHMIIDDTGPEYVTTPCMECEKGQQLAAKP
ncbi:hypothetical protein [Pseudomonas putida]|uniref:hypothetical protein n=1 Tax=Pseudomonas putida TaxID=303 RepID=UPI002264C06D|nr:hypothetical protein [Pseudomonas putida]